MTVLDNALTEAELLPPAYNEKGPDCKAFFSHALLFFVTFQQLTSTIYLLLETHRLIW